jgi:hypothetical protein
MFLVLSVEVRVFAMRSPEDRVTVFLGMDYPRFRRYAQ